MRVIAGEARGIPLVRPPSDIRPTMDKVRAAIFSSLGDLVPGARVLDLFAGSGGLGIEALSRGADSAMFVDASPRSVQCIKENLRKTKLTGSVQTMDALKFVELYAHEPYDLIFADPPYAKFPTDRDWASELLLKPQLAQALKPDGVLILERVDGAKDPEGCVLTLTRTRRYGESEVAYYRLPA